MYSTLWTTNETRWKRMSRIQRGRFGHRFHGRLHADGRGRRNGNRHRAAFNNGLFAVTQDSACLCALEQQRHFQWHRRAQRAFHPSAQLLGQQPAGIASVAGIRRTAKTGRHNERVHGFQYLIAGIFREPARAIAKVIVIT